jgi:YD repeat-containing protein
VSSVSEKNDGWLVTDAQNHATTSAYDAMGRLTKITYPGSTTTQFAYDIRGLRT